MKRTLLLLIASVFLLSSCTFLGNSTAVLWTDKPEIANFVELFNSEHENVKIVIEYKESPAKALLTETNLPDLIIGENFTASEIISSFRDLSKLFTPETLDPSNFYESILNLGKRGEEQLILPISFNLPILLFKKGNIQDAENIFSISMDRVKQLSAEFNEGSKPRRQIMGFSPRWSASYMYLYTLLYDVGFGENSSGSLAWNNQNLLGLITTFRDWSSAINGGIEKEDSFHDKYFYDPGFKLLENDRILFFYSDLRAFFALPQDIRENLDFRYIGEKNRIPVLENILYCGVPKKVKYKKAAKSFITWFFRPENISRCMGNNRTKQSRNFGIAGGFSSIPVVNEKDFPQYYPALGGHIPRIDYLKFPEPKPLDWDAVKREVLNPWLLNQTDNNGDIDSFNNELQKWLRQRS